jgi:rare lipoprotein A
MLPTKSRRSHALGIATCLALLAGCASTPLPRPASLPAPAASAPAVVGAPTMPAANSGKGGYYQDDGPGDNPPPNLLQTPDAEPRIEPVAKSTSRSYSVFGKTYTPINDERPFKQRGIGSWYGKKFHGQRTASGERYDMYKMTAAHPTLPIPSYARVTSIDSGKSVIVRINDRGPFHATRITDLSYTAALKLGLLGKGSHEVEVERILPDEIARMQRQPRATPTTPTTPATPATSAPMPAQVAGTAPVTTAVETASVSAPPPAETGTAMADALDAVSAPLASPSPQTGPANSGIWLQLGAYSEAGNAESMRMKLASNWQAPWPALQVVQAGKLYRLYSGPFDSRAQAQDVAVRMQNDGLAKALVVQR